MGGCNENRQFLIFLIIAHVPLLFCADGSLSWTFSVGYTKKKTPKQGLGAGASLVCPDFLSVGSILFTTGEGRAEHCSRNGCCRVGWSEQAPSTKVSARDNCLLGNTIISANKSCLHSHKQIILGPGWLAHFYYGNYFS